MYLEKTQRVKGFTTKDYYDVDREVINSENRRKFWGRLFDIKIRFKSDTFTWYSIFDELAYWRKANQVHRWFVENVQGGVDDCNPYPVSKEQLEELRSVVSQVLNDKSLAPVLLPTQDGFFFGPTNYDEFYFENLKYTLEAVNKTLKETDFEKEVVFYMASW